MSRVQSLGPRADDPDAEAWFKGIMDWLGYLEPPYNSWHTWSGQCQATGDDRAPCSEWPHRERKSDRLVCVAVPQVLPYLFCNPMSEELAASGDSKLVVLGGATETVWDFYDGSEDDFGPSPSRFVMTTHAAYLAWLADGIAGLTLSEGDLELVRDVATTMWIDMSRDDAGELTPAAHDLVTSATLDDERRFCPCPGCLTRRGGRST